MNVAIIYGGKSSEHEVSVITACLAKQHFKGNLYMVYLDKSNHCYLVPQHFSPAMHRQESFSHQVVFLFGCGQIGVLRGNKPLKRVPIHLAVNCCHGVCGEDGSVAALCRYANIPLVGSDLVPSAVAMDKVVTKAVLQLEGFPTLSGKAVYPSRQAQEPPFPFPVMVKPALLGSSIGVARCSNSDEYRKALTVAFAYGNKALVEVALTNFTEYNCAAAEFDGKVHTSKVVSPISANNLLTFNDKYIAQSKSSLPKPACTKVAESVKTLTEQIYSRLGFGGVIRVDYLADEDGNLFVNEINSVPGSLSYNLWENLSPTQFGDLLARQAFASHEQNSQLITDYASQILTLGKSKK